ncbi:hypothetical protein JHK82_039614 [Glycine max]|nr:hypothetical protein JHK86_039803 [Glycine max]KAG4965407.1 hypothetical protein JHK85_040382 [Glycine max]KAG5110391.1 hypothetical protein JHK82_039614 [Glycine max]KAG5121676.1 hypothetical protein JHK84_040016 [Glycine max]
MLLALRPGKFADNLCKKPSNIMDELREQAKGYIQMEEMSRFRNEPFPRGPRYGHYTPLTAKRATILEEAFNIEIPIKLPLALPPRPGLDRIKHCKYHRSYGHNTEDYWTLKDKIEELMQAGYLA